MTAGGAGGPSWVDGPATGELRCLPVDGLPEVAAGDDLAALLAAAVRLEDGDIVVVTSKVVSKAEGQVRTATREQAVADETERVVARRGRTTIVRTRHGLVMAAAGVDASNTDPDTVVLLPRDPDASARRLRVQLARRTGRNVAVLVTDTAGRAWRHGQTDIAIGAAGLDVLHDYAGVRDPHGNELAVTAPAVADELAAAADLVKRKLARRPAAVLRGLAGLVLEPGDDGPGAVSLVREDASDMFGLGAREAVLSALRAEDPRGFGAACSAVELVEHLAQVARQEPPLEGAPTPAGDGRAVVRVEEGAWTDAAEGAPAAQPQPVVTVRLEGSPRSQGAAAARVRTAAFALGWQLTEHPPPDAPPDVLGAGAPLPDTASGRVFLRFRPVAP